MLSYHVHSQSTHLEPSDAAKQPRPFLLLAHGALSNSAQWALNIDALSRVCTPVTVELLGHGDSPAPDDPKNYEPEAYVDYFEQIRQALGAQRWFLCGYSLSAGLVMRYAMAHPARVYGSLFTNSRSAFAGPDRQAEWTKSGEKTLKSVAARGLSVLEKMPVHPRFAQTLPKAVYDPLLERSKQLNPQGAALTLAVTAPTVSVRDRVKENSRPVLMLHGIREKGFLQDAEFARSKMPRLETTEVDAGHGVNMQAAEAFNNRVREFVAKWAT